jgi:hypothetical protein
MLYFIYKMKKHIHRGGVSRRTFCKAVAGGICLPLLGPFNRFVSAAVPDPLSRIFWVKNIPYQPFLPEGSGNDHAGIEWLLTLMAEHGLKLYRSPQETALGGPDGLIQPDDVVLIKVNAQWKYRGCTNSDVIRGLIQKILDHPDGFIGEVVIFENGQGRGSLNCDTRSNYYDSLVHANANDERHSFLYLVNTIFRDPRVSSYLLDPIRGRFIAADDHHTDGYRRYEDVSYPCFTTAGGTRIELKEGIWQGNGYGQNLKLINVPVLKHHDTGGSEITASLKHLYGILSMSDGNSSVRHYSGLGSTCGKMMVSVRTPVLNIIDSIWVSHRALKGYPADTTFRANMLLAGQDPVALDYWAAKYIIHPIDFNNRHHPDYPGISRWLSDAEQIINERGGLYHPEAGILAGFVTKNEAQMETFVQEGEYLAPLEITSPNGSEVWQAGTSQTIRWSYNDNIGSVVKIDLLKNGSPKQTISSYAPSGNNGIGSFAWSIPSTLAPASDYKIRITSASNSNINDSSDADFAIAPPPPPEIAVTYPNGSEILQAGTTQTIRWTYKGNIGYGVKIELLKSGSVNRTIAYYASKGTNGSGSFNWAIPSTFSPAPDYSIRITSLSSGNVKDNSDAGFTIVPPPPPGGGGGSPNGPDTWDAGTVQSIRWNYNGDIGWYVKIELLKNGGLNRTIAYAVSRGNNGNGSYNWTIPSAQSPGPDYRIRITSISKSAVKDTSDADFTIS